MRACLHKKDGSSHISELNQDIPGKHAQRLNNLSRVCLEACGLADSDPVRLMTLTITLRLADNVQKGSSRLRGLEQPLPTQPTGPGSAGRAGLVTVSRWPAARHLRAVLTTEPRDSYSPPGQQLNVLLEKVQEPLTQTRDASILCKHK